MQLISDLSLNQIICIKTFNGKIKEMKKMNYKILLITLIATTCAFLIVNPTVATHTTQIKVYSDYSGNEIGNDLYLNKKDNGKIAIKVTLHVDDGNPQWYRWIHFYLYDPQGKQIHNEEHSTAFGSARFCRGIDDLKSGSYKLCIIYWGNEDDDYPRADKEINIHITE